MRGGKRENNRSSLTLPQRGSPPLRGGRAATESRATRSALLLLRLARLHLVAHGLLRRGDHLDGAALRRDLLGRGLRDVVRPDRELPAQVALAQDADAVGGAVGQAGLLERLQVDDVAVLEGVF